MQPSQKSSRSRARKRRAHKHLTPVAVVDCPRCNQHSACANCGYVRPGLSLNIAKED